MFIVKLVCDKCGTQANTEDKFCRECGTKGVPELSKKLDADEFTKLLEKHKKESGPRCRTCGEIIQGYTGHVCKGLIQKQPHQPSKFYDDNIKWGHTVAVPAIHRVYTNDDPKIMLL